MTDTAAPGVTASPVDFDTYGRYAPRPSAFAKVDGQTRIQYPIQGRLSDDGSSGWPAEPGRYHLYVSLTCPWAQRPLIALKLRDLDGVVTWSAVDPVRDGRGWAFRDGPDHGPDPVNRFTLLRDAYLATDPAFDGHISVPALWDRATNKLVSNHFPTLTTDLETQFAEVADPDVDLYPSAQQAEIDELNEQTTAHLLRHGLEPATLATTLSQYDERLGDRRFLLAGQITDADVLLYVALVRLDLTLAAWPAAERPRLADYARLWAYARDLYQNPAFTETTNFEHLDRQARATDPAAELTATDATNRLSQWSTPHDRDRQFFGWPVRSPAARQ